MRTGADERRGHNTHGSRAHPELLGRRWILIPSVLAVALAAGIVVAMVAWLDPSEEEPNGAPSAASAVLPRENPASAPAAPLTDRSVSLERAGTGNEVPPLERTGIAVFPPPGTEPLKRGLIVPDDFELPPGYVRHYQTTDDGRRLPPILMFHPDYRPVGPDGKPIPLPADRVVPPELAPPGFPIEPAVRPAEVHRDTR